MADSQSLVAPYFVQLNSVAKDGVTAKAFPFLVVHEGPSDSGSDQKWGWAYIADEDNQLGLGVGVAYLADVGLGGPGQNVSWSPLT